MYVNPKLRLNRFRQVPCLSPRELYRKYGLSDPAVVSSQTAENVHETIPMGTSKTKLLALAKDVAEKAAEFKVNPDAQPLPRTDIK